MAGSFAVQLAGMALTFLVGVQLARGLGVDRYGQYGIAMAVISLAGIPAEFGLPRLVTREVAAAQASGNSASLFGILRWSERQCYMMSAAVICVILAGTLAAFHKISAPVAIAILVGLPVIPLAALGRLRGARREPIHQHRHRPLVKLGIALGPEGVGLRGQLGLALLRGLAGVVVQGVLGFDVGRGHPLVQCRDLGVLAEEVALINAPGRELVRPDHAAWRWRKGS